MITSDQAADDNAFVEGRVAERRDVIAFLERRQKACETMVKRSPDEAERGGAMMRQLSVLIGDVRAGLHEGDQAVADALANEALNGAEGAGFNDEVQ